MTPPRGVSLRPRLGVRVHCWRRSRTGGNGTLTGLEANPSMEKQPPHKSPQAFLADVFGQQARFVTARFVRPVPCGRHRGAYLWAGTRSSTRSTGTGLSGHRERRPCRDLLQRRACSRSGAPNPGFRATIETRRKTPVFQPGKSARFPRRFSSSNPLSLPLRHEKHPRPALPSCPTTLCPPSHRNAATSTSAIGSSATSAPPDPATARQPLRKPKHRQGAFQPLRVYLDNPLPPHRVTAAAPPREVTQWRVTAAANRLDPIHVRDRTFSTAVFGPAMLVAFARHVELPSRPCVLPIVPALFCYMGGDQHGRDRRRRAFGPGARR